MANRRHTREFKIAAVRLVNEQGYSHRDAGKRLGVDPSSVRDWVKKFSAELGLAPTGEGAVAAELRRLRAGRCVAALLHTAPIAVAPVAVLVRVDQRRR